MVVHAIIKFLIIFFWDNTLFFISVVIYFSIVCMFVCVLWVEEEGWLNQILFLQSYQWLYHV